MSKLISIFALLLLCGFRSSVATASPATFECDYRTYSDGEGLHKVGEPFRLTFLIDSKAKKAYLIGNNGSSEVEVIQNSDGLTLVEVTGTGNVMVTAITSKGTSVHSRNGIMMGDIIPSQYYGSCKQK